MGRDSAKVSRAASGWCLQGPRPMDAICIVRGSTLPLVFCKACIEDESEQIECGYFGNWMDSEALKPKMSDLLASTIFLFRKIATLEWGQIDISAPSQTSI
jgi:hypothetical protein